MIRIFIARTNIQMVVISLYLEKGILVYGWVGVVLSTPS